MIVKLILNEYFSQFSSIIRIDIILNERALNKWNETINDFDERSVDRFVNEFMWWF